MLINDTTRIRIIHLANYVALLAAALTESIQSCRVHPDAANPHVFTDDWACRQVIVGFYAKRVFNPKSVPG